MASRRRLGLVGLAAFVCLPGMLRARAASESAFPDSGSRTYVIHLSGSKPLAKVELSVAPASAEWEVTAVYDAARCEIHCTWRRKRDVFGTIPLWLPPIAAFRIYSNFVSAPATVTIDPAGLGLPCAARDAPLRHEAIFVPARKLFIAAPAQRSSYGAPKPPRTHLSPSIGPADTTSASSLPLRI